MEDTDNRLAIERYETLTAELYSEPVDGKFDNITRAVLGELGLSSSESEVEVEESEGSRSACRSES